MKDILRLLPIYKERIWGGDKIKNLYHRQDISMSLCGESWEISAVKGDISKTIDNIPLTDLIAEYKGTLLGEEIFNKYKGEFPLLVKIIDAKEDLSIQIHPNNEKAKQNNSFGKTEVWHILEADKGAYIYLGFRDGVNIETIKQKIAEGTILEIINKIPVTKGDTYFIPSGLIHAIGKGIVIAEIQQTSDITYRFYDYDRVDSSGNKRELHIEKALECIDFSIDYKDSIIKVNNGNLVDCPYFVVNRISLTEGQTIEEERTEDAFKIIMCIEGSININGEIIREVETILLPNSTRQIISKGKGVYLEVYPK